MSEPSYMMVEAVAAMFAGVGPIWAAQMERQQCTEPARIAAFLASALNGQLLEAPILDVGCGTGLGAAALRQLCRRLEGIDLSPSMIEIAAQSGLYDELHLGEAVPFLRARTGYGAITAAGVCCFFNDLLPLFEAVAHALSPGGVFVCTSDHWAGPGEVAVSPRHQAMRLHSLQHIAGAAQAAGLQVRSYQRSILRLDFFHGLPIDGAVTVLRKE
jgi:predicted TPR repeat methyltransferase